jgi:hypothetical protein
VPVRSASPSESRSAQSELDRRAISVVGHLLTTGIWLEHQLRNIPTRRTSPVGGSRVRSPLHRSGSVDLGLSQPARRRVSPTGDLALTSR